MPNVEYGAPWMGLGLPKTLPHAIWESLTPHAQRICAGVKADPGVWPVGAGFNHPLAARRRAVNSSIVGQVRPADQETAA